MARCRFTPRSAATAAALMLLLALTAAALAVCAAAPPPAAADPANVYYLNNSIGGPGTGVGTFGSSSNPAPVSVAADGQGNVYALDWTDGGGMVQKFGRDGTWLAKFGPFDSADAAGELRMPYGIAVSSDGTVYVLDTWRTADSFRIQKFIPTNVAGTTYASDGQVDTGALAQGKGFFIAVDDDGNMYVTDNTTAACHVLKYSAAGTLTTTIGTYGSGPGQFLSVDGIAVSADGSTLYVCDNESRIKTFTRAASGSYSETASWAGDDIGTDFAPFAVALGKGGDLFALDNTHAMWAKLSSSGAVLSPPQGGIGTGWEGFRYPEGIAVDSDGDVYIADPGAGGGLPADLNPGNHRVAHFVRDLSAPWSTAAVAPLPNAKGWIKAASAMVTFSGGDTTAPDQAMSGYFPITYRLDGGAWTSSETSVPPDGYSDPVTITKQGVTAVEYFTEDAAGNVEGTHTLKVRLDNVHPTTKALYDASVRRGHRVTLRYRVTDRACPLATVTIKLKKVGSSATKTLPLGLRATGSNLGYSYNCSLTKGTWTWKVYATDRAGNAQSTMIAKKLTVK